MSRSFWPHGLQHVSLLCPLSPRVCSKSVSQWCHPTMHPLPSPFPSAFNLSQHQHLFQWASSLHQVAEVLESFQWIFRTDSFRIDWFDILAVQGTLKSLLQHHSLKGSTLWRSAFFMVQLSHPYITTGKSIALKIETSRQSDVSSF